MIDKLKNPYLIIILSFFGTILIGSILLVLPWAVEGEESLSYIDALFTSTSSVCVTGLSVVPNVGATFSVFGKIVIAILIEIGGLSFLTIAIFIIILTGAKIGMTERFLMKEALNQNTLSGINRLVKMIIKTALLIQGIGIVFSFFALLNLGYEPLDALGVGVFHTISSFNNAGFDIFGTESSMIPFANDIFLNVVTMVLIVLGGVGFVVIYDVAIKRSFKKYSLHVKIVLLMTVVLIIAGTLLFKLGNENATWLQSIFQSVTARTAGFATFDMKELSNAGFGVMTILMFIGASPCSTGGGVKTTTIFVLMATIVSYATGRHTNAFKRELPSQVVFKAFALVTLSVFFIGLSILTLSFVETGMDIKAIIFEVVSAFATVGLSMGITAELSTLGKIIIAVTMFVGRLGPLTLLSVWNKRWASDTKEGIRLPEEKIIIG